MLPQVEHNLHITKMRRLRIKIDLIHGYTFASSFGSSDSTASYWPYMICTSDPGNTSYLNIPNQVKYLKPIIWN